MLFPIHCKNEKHNGKCVLSFIGFCVLFWVSTDFPLVSLHPNPNLYCIVK
jgi:hypothetical protein